MLKPLLFVSSASAFTLHSVLQAPAQIPLDSLPVSFSPRPNPHILMCHRAQSLFSGTSLKGFLSVSHVDILST